VDKAASFTSPRQGELRAQQLVDNLATLMDAINRARPTGAKGQYLRR